MTFKTETAFEQAFIETLFNKGWENTVIKNPTEQDLINNWAKILFENNSGIDRLNGQPLTDSEMAQILEQIKTLRTPLALNGFINGKTVSIKRDNPNDPAHLGKEISLSIYDRQQIAAGESRYQIVQQPKFPTSSPILNDRRGDIMLLINGMPLFHIELKRSGIPVSQAAHQIENYARSGVFSGLFSLVQIFVAMNPEETKYFANPGPDGSFKSDYYFNWADFNNEPINYWKDIAGTLLSIPMAHQLIGFYTVADKTDGVLKVMRSYQYFAVRAISDRVARIEWDGRDRLGGYIWHTTGSGKTMTSFKSAYLIATSKDADKVIFLMDRIELGTQSLEQYNNFADTDDFVQSTENTHALISKLKSTNPNEVLIVSSIQKMSNIKQEEGGLKAHDIEQMQKKRIVIIVDEAHRSTFGDMLITIKETFPQAVFFGFTGTPIQDENEKNMNTTATVFGHELHRYSIADGIRDKNVLGFDPYLISTYKDSKLREAVALDEAKANTVREALTDPKKKEIYLRFMDKSQVAMAGHWDKANNYVKGIEDYLPTEQYRRPAHQKKVVEDILENWIQYSQNNKFHGMFATSSIAEAIEYYRLFKKLKPELKITALFDPNIDNNENAKFKEDGLVEIISDYNNRYGMEFSLAILALRYKELFSEGGSGGGGGSVPFEIDGYLTEIDTDKIDSDYMNSRFTKYLKALHDGEKTISVEEALNELHKSFAALTHDEQRIANIFLHDVQRGDVKLQEAKSFRDYITEYQFKAKEDEIHAIATSFGLDESKLRQLISAHVNENNINEFARFDALLNTVDKAKAKQYFEQEEGKPIPPFKVNVKVAAFLKEFVLKSSQPD